MHVCVYVSVCVSACVAWKKWTSEYSFFFFFFFFNFRGILIQRDEHETVIFSKPIHTKSGDLKLQEVADD